MSCLCHRPRDKQRSPSPVSELHEFDGDMFMMPPTDDRTSTPFEMSTSMMSTTDPHTQMKIEALEEELSQLRLQIAQLVKVQEKPTTPLGNQQLDTIYCPASHK